MEFPKPIMTINELVLMGFSEKMLRRMYQVKGYPYAFKEIPSKTAPIKIDTTMLERYLKQIN